MAASGTDGDRFVGDTVAMWAATRLMLRCGVFPFRTARFDLV